MAKHVERLLDVILSQNYRDLLDEYGKPVIPSNEIYAKISAVLKNDIKPKYIYIILKENRYGTLDKIRKFHNIDTPDSTLLKSTTFSSDSFTRDKTLEFNITFSYKDWIIMSLRMYYTLKKNRVFRNYCMLKHKIWTDKIYAAIHKATKLPCALVFKNSKISGTGMYLIVKGSCKECNCIFLGYVVNKPPPKTDVIIERKIRNFDESVRHKRKRQLSFSLTLTHTLSLSEYRIVPIVYMMK